jgi:hypothetical protein
LRRYSSAKRHKANFTRKKIRCPQSCTFGCVDDSAKYHEQPVNFSTFTLAARRCMIGMQRETGATCGLSGWGIGLAAPARPATFVQGEQACVSLPLSPPASPPSAQAQVVIRCAREGQNCYVPSSTQILYGRDGATVIKNLNGQTIDCTDAAFGHNPLVGSSKICILLYHPPGRESWAPCDLNTTCNGGSGAGMIVRYGDPVSQTWIYHSFTTTSVYCEQGPFGGDPKPGVPKRCAWHH